MARRLEIISKREKRIIIMVLCRETQLNNDNEYYLINPSNIRKENTTDDDPEYIVLLDENNVFQGIFKHLESSVHPSCWKKVW